MADLSITTLSPDDYIFASCAGPRRTTTTKPRKSSSYADRNRRFFALDANDAVARTLEAR